MEQKSILAGSARYARFEVAYQTTRETIINTNILISKKARKKSRLGSIPPLPERKGLNKLRAHYRISCIEYGNHMSMQTFHNQNSCKLHKEGATNQLVSESHCKDATGIPPRIIISYSASNQCIEATYLHRIFRFTQLFSYCRT